MDEVVCDSKWHEINATLDNTEMVLSIDGGPVHRESFGGGTGRLAESTVIYIGGLPGGCWSGVW